MGKAKKQIDKLKPATIRKDGLEYGLPTTFPGVECYVQGYDPAVGSYVVALRIGVTEAIGFMRSAIDDRWVPKGYPRVSDKLLKLTARDCGASSYGFLGDWFMWEVEENSLCYR